MSDDGTATESPIAQFRRHCEHEGLDVVHPFAVAWFNTTVDDSERLPDFGRAPCLGILVGNTRRLWPVFKRAVEQGDRFTSGDPLDDHVVSVVTSAATLLGVATTIRWAHTTAPRPIPIQRVAQAAGLACLSPSHLSVHPTFGPWLALRAVVAIDLDGPEGPPPVTHDPCGPCTKPCLAPLDDALRSSAEEPTALLGLGPGWKRWLAVRDACPEGRAHRYGDEQIEYHYTKRKSLLRSP